MGCVKLFGKMETELPEGVKIPWPRGISANPDLDEGKILARARIILEGRYQDFERDVKAAYEAAKVGGQKPSWQGYELKLLREYGYTGFNDELRRHHARNWKAPESPPIKVDAKADLEEAYDKFDRTGLKEVDFVRPRAWFWYQQYWAGDEQRAKVVQVVNANLVSPIAKAKAVVEAPEEVEVKKKSKAQLDELHQFIKEREG